MDLCKILKQNIIFNNKEYLYHWQVCYMQSSYGKMKKNLTASSGGQNFNPSLSSIQLKTLFQSPPVIIYFQRALLKLK